MLASMMLATACAVGATAQTAVPQPVAVAPSRLLPLRETDQAAAPGAGCLFTFSQGDAAYVALIGQDLRFRTTGGLRRCRLSPERSERFIMGGEAVACGGQRLSLRSVGRAETDAATDSASGDAVLTLTQGPRSRTVRGFWATAC